MKIIGIGKNYVNDKSEISTYKNGKKLFSQNQVVVL